MSSISIISFNILASVYASPDYYPDECAPYLDTSNRSIVINKFLFNCNYDIIGLQEVTQTEYAILMATLDNKYTSCFFPHDETYCNEWMDPENTQPNGNAIFLANAMFKDTIWSDIRLASGNHVVSCLTNTISNIKLRITNIHLDGDDMECRRKEYLELLDQLSFDPDMIDIVLGDFNDGLILIDIAKQYPIRASATGRNDGYHFKDAINSVLTYSMAGAAKTKQPIDHITYRYGKDLTVTASVLDKNMWIDYPVLNEHDPLCGPRCCMCLELYGSDHIPVAATLNILLSERVL